VWLGQRNPTAVFSVSQTGVANIFSFSELPTHMSSNEIFKILNGFIEERGLEWKNCFGICTDGAACLTGRNSGLVNKIKDMACNNLLSMHC
jgi:hypothetical protein